MSLRHRTSKLGKDPKNSAILTALKGRLIFEETTNPVPASPPLERKRKGVDKPTKDIESPAAESHPAPKRIHEIPMLEGMESHFVDHNRTLVGTASYLPNQFHQEKQAQCYKRIQYYTQQLLKGTPLENKNVLIGLEVNWESYDLPKTALSEPYVHLKGNLTIEEAGKVATLFSQLLQKPVSMQLAKIDAPQTWENRRTHAKKGGEATPAYSYYLNNVSLLEIAQLSNVQLLAGNRLAQEICKDAKRHSR